MSPPEGSSLTPACCLLGTTGASDGSVRVWDRRLLPATGAASMHCVKELKHHNAAIMRVEWHPHEQVRGLCYAS